jgi:hypothetical protein
VFATGTQGSLLLGQVATQGTASVAVTGVQAEGAAGPLGFVDVAVHVVGVHATGRISSALVWGVVDDSDVVTWDVVNDNNAVTWAPVNNNNVVTWTTIST